MELANPLNVLKSAAAPYMGANRWDMEGKVLGRKAFPGDLQLQVGAHERCVFIDAPPCLILQGHCRNAIGGGGGLRAQSGKSTDVCTSVYKQTAALQSATVRRGQGGPARTIECKHRCVHEHAQSLQHYKMLFGEKRGLRAH
eukprot:26143-Pelagomonas_calceolata.AAC.8